MKLVSPTRLGISTALLGGLVLTMGGVGFRAKADVWDKKTILTIDQPIQVEETYLEPGTYVFKLLNSDSNRHIVQIYDRDQRHMIHMLQAIPNYRLQPTGNSRFTFYETPAGSVRAMRAWFYPGDNYGQEFRYPKELKQVAFAITSQPVTHTQDVVTQDFTKDEGPALTAREREEPAPAPVAAATEPAPVVEPEQHAAEEPVILAQNTNQNTDNSTNTQVTQSQTTSTQTSTQNTNQIPSELPKTATPFPLIGLSGLIALAGYAWLKKSPA